eukprot:CAMPEP_0197541010 /NCGR_PEP_ID=MMETSP1318-20131121/66921_1 /TAXON_ID=552666 /ORGANISM="Partenskyella glossopodia, Strain RCC365" /LENGTH=374 /DNA_ID=CAMNT_0043100135 /DNA_START=743 /DNA_END=1867 /DNA_ORIENTATION=+
MANVTKNEKRKHWGVEWEPGTNNPVLKLKKGQDESGSEYLSREFDIVLGVDGAASAVRDQINQKQTTTSSPKKSKNVYHQRYPPRNTRVYRTIELDLPGGWRSDVNYAARGDASRDLLFDALPLSESKLLGTLLSKPGDPRMKGSGKDGNLSPKEARRLLDDLFPQFSAIASDKAIEEFCQKEDSRLPEFSYVNGPLYLSNSTALLGDAIHTVKPYFGLGVNSAFEDVMELNKALDDSDGVFADALPLYSKRRSPSVKALVEISRSYDREMKNPLQTAAFVIPLILDSTLNKYLPKIFERTALGMMQDERYSFDQIRRRKARDRFVQGVAVASMLTGMGYGGKFLFMHALKAAAKLIQSIHMTNAVRDVIIKLA